MDKVVILFKGGVETQEYFSIEMSKTFQKHGYEIYWFDLVLSGLSAKQLCDFYKADKSKKFMAFTFNFNGIAGEDGLYDESFEGGSFWNETKIPVYNMVVDHPLYYHKYLPLRPVFQRDRDRVLHCKAFRRLKQKTQVFLSPECIFLTE